MDTLGALVDKLSIVNIRLWHLEDIRRDQDLSDKKRLKAADAVSVANSQRNQLIDEVDEYLAKALADPEFHRTFNKLKMY